MYMTAIDVSKAFDKVNRTHLWAKLIQKGIVSLIVRVLIAYYNDAWMLVQKDNEVGGIFRTTVGVRQGGVISPKLFSMYLNDLIEEIEATDCVTEIGSIKINVLLYADDIVLLSHTKSEMQRLLDVTSSYGAKNDFIFNADKTNYLVFNSKIGASKEITDNNLILKLDGSTRLTNSDTSAILSLRMVK